MAVPLVSSARFEVCVGSSTGRRPSMEDEVVVVGMGPAHNPNEDFFAVFDGHGGRDAAIYAAKNLYLKIGRNFALSPSEPLKSITSAFEETNAWMMQQRMGSGSTAAMSFIVDSTLYTANVGDTRVVLGWKDRKAVRLSFDHKPSVAAEKERIERLGGEVTKKFGVARVNGVLGVSRAFGDCKLVPYVSAVPHVNILELTDETMFLIIACDGLWDEFTDQEAVELVFQKANTVQNIGEYLSNVAIMRGSQDNVSVVVVFLNPRNALYESDGDDEEDEDDEDDDDEDFEAADTRNGILLPTYQISDEDDEDDEGDSHNLIATAYADQLQGKKSPIRRTPSPNSMYSSSSASGGSGLGSNNSSSSAFGISTSSLSSGNGSAHSSTASIGLLHQPPSSPSVQSTTTTNSNSTTNVTTPLPPSFSSSASLAYAIHRPASSSSSSFSPSLTAPSSITSMRNTSLLMSRTLISGGGGGNNGTTQNSSNVQLSAPLGGVSSANAASSAELLSRPSFRAKMVSEEEDSSDSDDEMGEFSGGLGVSVNAWTEEDSE